MTDLAKLLQSTIGGNDDPSTVTCFINSGFPPLNDALSSNYKTGGFPGGRIIEIAGPPSSGKTALATMAMISAQRQGGIAGFNDHERSFEEPLAVKLGLDTTPGKFVYKKPRTFEDSITICVQFASAVREHKLIPEDAPIVWVFDSLASMVPQSALIDKKTNKDKAAGDRTMNDNTALARATSAHFPAFNQHCEEYNICAIFLNQVRKDIGVVYGDNNKTSGGEAPKFYASQRVILNAKPIRPEKSDDIIGQEVTAKLMKNKITRPFKKATWRFMFNEDGSGDFAFELSLINFMIAKGMLESKQAGWVTWEEKRTSVKQLAEKIRAEGRYQELIDMMPDGVVESSSSSDEDEE